MSAEQAQAVLARSGRTFHLASRLLPTRMRTDAAELYAFCRRMDDLADESVDGEPAQQRLAEVISALERDPLGEEVEALGWPVDLESRFPGISKIAVTLTRALAADTGPRRIATEPDLLRYAFGVAGTVGLMMCRILGAPPEGAQAASHFGIAMQLTNIARDVREDFGRDRIYLPGEWIEPKAVESALAGAQAEPLAAATRRLLALADAFYQSADRGMHYVPLRARVGILAAGACYREIGVVVARDIPASWRRRAVVAGRRKAALVSNAVPAALLSRKPSSAGLSESSRTTPLEQHGGGEG